MKTTKKQAAQPKLSEKAIKSIQNVQHLREELNHLADDFLKAASKSKFDTVLLSGIKSTANELKDAAKKIKKHLAATGSKKTKLVKRS